MLPENTETPQNTQKDVIWVIETFSAGLREVQGRFKKLQVASSGLSDVSRGSEGFREIFRGFRGFQGVSGAFHGIAREFQKRFERIHGAF